MVRTVEAKKARRSLPRGKRGEKKKVKEGKQALGGNPLGVGPFFLGEILKKDKVLPIEHCGLRGAACDLSQYRTSRKKLLEALCNQWGEEV